MICPIPSPTQPHQLFRNTSPYGNVAGRNLVVMMMVVVVVNIMVMAMMVGANITNTKAFQHFVTLAQEKFCDIQYMTQHKSEIRG